MTTQRLYRLYAQEVFGKEARKFRALLPRYGGATLVTLDKKGNREWSDIDFQEMISWIGKKLKDDKVILESVQTSQKIKDTLENEGSCLFSRYRNDE